MPPSVDDPPRARVADADHPAIAATPARRHDPRNVTAALSLRSAANTLREDLPHQGRPVIDTQHEQGATVAARLRDKIAIWLTTVSAVGQPQSSPVWFFWDGADELLVFSRPNVPRVRNIAANPRVACNLDGDHAGGEVTMFEGEALIDTVAPAATELTMFKAKFAERIAALGCPPEVFARDYPVVIRIRITRTRPWQ
jgi:PPOX class probable F420-dependent enzyme